SGVARQTRRGYHLPESNVLRRLPHPSAHGPLCSRHPGRCNASRVPNAGCHRPVSALHLAAMDQPLAVPGSQGTHPASPGCRRAQDCPYTGTSAPRVTRLSGEARKAIVAATSSSLGHFAKSAAGIALRLARVSMIEGTTALTQMLVDASSAPRDCVIAATAALLAV